LLCLFSKHLHNLIQERALARSFLFVASLQGGGRGVRRGKAHRALRSEIRVGRCGAQ